MKTFGELLECLDWHADREFPPKGYEQGLACAAWRLWCIAMSEHVNAQTVAAIKEIADRCVGKSTTPDKTTNPSFSDYLMTLPLDKLTAEELDAFEALIKKLDIETKE